MTTAGHGPDFSARYARHSVFATLTIQCSTGSPTNDLATLGQMVAAIAAGGIPLSSISISI